MFEFTSLQGARASSGACQSLLEFDGGIKILVGVGWNESFDVKELEAIERYAFAGILRQLGRWFS